MRAPELLKRIEIHSEVMLGKPNLERNDVLAALAYAGRTVRNLKPLVPH